MPLEKGSLSHAPTDPCRQPKYGLPQVYLGAEELKLAERFAAALFRATSGVERLIAKQERTNEATASFKSREKLDKAREILVAALEASPEGKIARNPASRIKGVTLGLLDRLVKEKDSPIVELTGVENIKMGRTKRAYALAKDLKMDKEKTVAGTCAEASSDSSQT